MDSFILRFKVEHFLEIKPLERRDTLPRLYFKGCRCRSKLDKHDTFVFVPPNISHQAGDIHDLSEQKKYENQAKRKRYPSIWPEAVRFAAECDNLEQKDAIAPDIARCWKLVELQGLQVCREKRNSDFYK